MKKILTIVLLGIVLVLGFAFLNSKDISAANNDSKIKLESLLIKSGDTLTSIARKQINTYSLDITVNEYVKEIKRMNGLSDDTIHAGNYILVYHY